MENKKKKKKKRIKESFSIHRVRAVLCFTQPDMQNDVSMKSDDASRLLITGEECDVIILVTLHVRLAN
jgi:hypothetical protein